MARNSQWNQRWNYQNTSQLLQYDHYHGVVKTFTWNVFVWWLNWEYFQPPSVNIVYYVWVKFQLVWSDTIFGYFQFCVHTSTNAILIDFVKIDFPFSFLSCTSFITTFQCYLITFFCTKCNFGWHQFALVLHFYHLFSTSTKYN